ncbi:hypothetical protein BLNAU_1217 [Blattamonas nauphoetae]|uniref:Uncharacterized protein n=2 Tax=Blattamonas nauphoetae TaxID=2049346 RepID=A0ABQ9YIR9_9EUKA|nr:hypothetical protein BLNAU_1217 [Blattamonas nauphoetae]
MLKQRVAQSINASDGQAGVLPKTEQGMNDEEEKTPLLPSLAEIIDWCASSLPQLGFQTTPHPHLPPSFTGAASVSPPPCLFITINSLTLLSLAAIILHITESSDENVTSCLPILLCINSTCILREIISSLGVIPLLPSTLTPVPFLTTTLLFSQILSSEARLIKNPSIVNPEAIEHLFIHLQLLRLFKDDQRLNQCLTLSATFFERLINPKQPQNQTLSMSADRAEPNTPAPTVSNCLSTLLSHTAAFHLDHTDHIPLLHQTFPSEDSQALSLSTAHGDSVSVTASGAFVFDDFTEDGLLGELLGGSVREDRHIGAEKRKELGQRLRNFTRTPRSESEEAPIGEERRDGKKDKLAIAIGPSKSIFDSNSVHGWKTFTHKFTGKGDERDGKQANKRKTAAHDAESGQNGEIAKMKRESADESDTITEENQGEMDTHQKPSNSSWERDVWDARQNNETQQSSAFFSPSLHKTGETEWGQAAGSSPHVSDRTFASPSSSSHASFQSPSLFSAFVSLHTTPLPSSPPHSPLPNRTFMDTSTHLFPSDCSQFLNWVEDDHVSEHEKAVVFRSLVVTVKSQHTLNASLEEKTVNSFASNSDTSSTNFLQSIVVLISSPNRVITVASMKMLNSLIRCSQRVRLALVKAELIPHLINTLNPLSLPFAETVDIHINLMTTLWNSLWLATPNCLADLKIEGSEEQQAVHETIFRQVVAPSAKSKSERKLYNSSLASFADESLTNFVQSIVVLVSSPSRIITVATMEMVKALTMWCSSRDQYALVQADLIPQLIITLSAQSLPVADAVDIHTSLLNIIVDSLWLSTPRSLAFLGNQDENGQQHVHETIMKQVVAPSEKSFLELIARILRISPYYQQTMDFILGLPVFLTVPCCLTFFEYDGSIWCFLHTMNHARWEWNKGRGEVRQMWKKVLQMLRMEGIEDVIEEKLEIDRNGTKGREIVIFSIDWNNLQGMNLSERE